MDDRDLVMILLGYIYPQLDLPHLKSRSLDDLHQHNHQRLRQPSLSMNKRTVIKRPARWHSIPQSSQPKSSLHLEASLAIFCSNVANFLLLILKFRHKKGLGSSMNLSPGSNFSYKNPKFGVLFTELVIGCGGRI